MSKSKVILWEGWLRAVVALGILVAAYHAAAWAGYDSDILALAAVAACWFIPGWIVKAAHKRADEYHADQPLRTK